MVGELVTGADLAAEVEDFLARSGMSRTKFARLSIGSTVGLTKVLKARAPSDHSIARVRGVMTQGRSSEVVPTTPDDRISERRQRDQAKLAERFAEPRQPTQTERVRAAARDAQRDVLADGDPVTPAEMIARAQRDFPLMWGRCRELAPTLQLAASWRRPSSCCPAKC
jgi:hypothetical protein